MELKDLDKSQLALLTIMIAFVVSIATSIVTFTLLLDKLQPQKTEVVNRIIQITKEPSSDSEIPIVTVKEIDSFDYPSSELALKTIRKNSVVIYRDKKKIGIGAAISENGDIVVTSLGIGTRGFYTADYGEGQVPIDFFERSDLFTIFRPTSNIKIDNYFSILEIGSLDIGIQALIYDSDHDEEVINYVITSQKENEKDYELLSTVPKVDSSSQGSLAVGFNGDFLGLVVRAGSTSNKIYSAHSIALYLKKE